MARRQSKRFDMMLWLTNYSYLDQQATVRECSMAEVVNQLIDEAKTKFEKMPTSGRKQ
jgi:hypothetical protein